MTRSMTMFVFLLAATGCSSSDKGGSGTPGNDAVLHEVGGMIQIFSGENNRGPKKAADLAKYENGYPLGYKAVQKGDVVVIWGVKMAGEGDLKDAPPHVLAYEKTAPDAGGMVLLLNGTVKQMSSAEFAAAPKAK